MDRERGVINGPATGWIPENASFYLDGSGYHVGSMVTRTKLRQRPRWPVSGLNAATVEDNTLGLYTSDWGWTKGYSVTDGDKDVREVVVVDGRIKSNKAVLSKGRKVRGQVLVGRGSAAKLLKQLKVGRKATFKFRTKPGAQVAVSGDRSILLDGVRTVINDRLLHPRTAVGIDTDGNRLLFLVIDGRSASSRGYTMVELATMMTALGAENALNLDGGGSSTCTPARSPARWASSTSPPTAGSARSPTASASSTTGSSRRSPRPWSRRRPRRSRRRHRDALTRHRPAVEPTAAGARGALAPRAPARPAQGVSTRKSATEVTGTRHCTRDLGTTPVTS